jgi:GNAT superfamily N-acetyltransferase
MLAVAEGWRLTDIGQRLLAEVGHRASGQGVTRFVAEIVPRNAALRAAARALGLPEHRTGVSVEIDVTRLA